MRDQVWYRNAGARRYHLARPDWVRSGKAVCGEDIGRPYVSWDAAGSGFATPPSNFVRLAQYPQHWGMVRACAHCAKPSAREQS